MARVILNTQEINRLLQSPSGPVAQDLLIRGNRVKNAAQRLCPVDQGRLRASISTELAFDDGELVVRVGTNVDYAIYVHNGTGIYGPEKRPIVPVRAKALRWAQRNNSGRGRRRYRNGSTDGYVYSKRSKGTRGRPFLTKALPAGRQSTIS